MDQPLTITSSCAIVQSPKILDTDLNDEVLIMHVDSGKYICLKDVAADIWRLLKKPHDVTAIVETLMTNYDVERDVCEKEVISYLNDLRSDDLLDDAAAAK